MANIFDRFDGQPAGAPPAAPLMPPQGGGNAFDQFDAAPQPTAAPPAKSPMVNAMLPLHDDQGGINIMPELHREMDNLRGLQDKILPDNFIGDIGHGANAVGNWLLESMLGGGNAMAKGARDLGVGVAKLPTDIMAMEDAPGAAEASQAIGNAVPDIKTDSTAQGITAAITQYGTPAGAGAKLVGAIPKLAELSPVVQWAMRLLGAGAGDAVATDPDNASTIGNLAPTIAPTAIQPDDSNIAKRMKVGAESTIVGGVADGVLKLLGKGVDAAAPAFTNFTKEGRKFSVGKEMAEAGVPENVAAEAKNLEGGNYKPLVSDVVNTPQTQGIARGLLNAPDGAGLVNRVKENEAAISQNFDEALSPQKGVAPSSATNEFQRQKTGKLAVPDQSVANIENAQTGVEARNATNTAQISANAGTRQDAASTLSDLIEQERANATDVKNGLYAQATELGRGVSVDPAALADTATAVRSDIGPLAAQDQSLNGILGDLSRLAPEGEPVPTGVLGADGNPITRAPDTQPVTLADLIDLRPRLSRAIDQATGKYRGDVVQHLMDLRRQIDGQINSLSEGSGPAVDALRTAESHFRDTFAPKFREGQGGAVDKAAKTGNPVPPTAMGDTFLKSNANKGAREAVDDLNRIFADSESRPAAQAAARNYMTGLMADQLGNNVTGPRVAQFIAKYSEAIDGVPGLRQEMQQQANRLNAGSTQTAALDEGLTAAQKARAGTETAFDQSPAGVWLKGDVDSSINEAMGSPQKMKQLVAAARKDGTGAAVTDVKNRIKAKINDMIRNDGSEVAGGSAKPGTNTAKPLENKDVVVSLAQANNLLKEGTKEREAMKAVFSPAEMKNLDLYRKQLALTARTASMRGLKNSDTTLNTLSGLQSGAGVMAGDIRGSMFVRLLKWVDKTTLNTTGKRNELMIKALTDPELAGTLVMDYNDGTAAVVERKLSTYLTNNVMSVDTPDSQKKQAHFPERTSANFDRNKVYTKPGAKDFATTLQPKQEEMFRKWLKTNKVPFDAESKDVQDYDMRGFYKAFQAGDPKAKSAVDPNDKRMHYPDYWKTPYHETFSNESQWATPDAPKWNDKDQLVDKNGKVLFDDRAQKKAP